MRFRSFAVTLLFMTSLCGLCSGVAAADGLDALYQRTFAIDLRDYAAGNGAQVAVGYYYSETGQGNVLTSANGIDWKQVTLFDEVSYGANAIVFFNGRFIIPGTDAVYTSTDGSSWSKVPETAGFQLDDIASGKGLLVGVGGGSSYWGGRIVKSTDGVTWLSVADGLAYGLNAVAYGTASGTFAAVGNNGVIYTCQSSYAVSRGSIGYDLSDIAYGNGTFVAVGAKGAIATSTNSAKGKSNNEGTYWTLRSSGTMEPLSSVAYGNGTFVAGGTDFVLTSPDGITWTQRTFGTPASSMKIRFDGSKFVAVGNDGVMLTSPDGIAWTTIIPATPGPIGTLVTNGSVIIAAGSSQGTVLTSPDGVRWTARYLPGRENLVNFAYGKGLFAGIGRDDAGTRVVMTSPDGIAWTRGDLGFGDWLTEIAFGNDAFVIVTGGGTIFTSTDAATWIPGYLSGAPASVTFKDGNFVAVASHKVYGSPDGFNWNEYAVNFQTSMGAIVPGSVTSAIVGPQGGLFTSSGYKNWRERTSPFSALSQSSLLGFGDNTFMAADGHGGILTSNDGRSWIDRILAPLFVPHGAIFINDSFVFAGEPFYSTWSTANKGGMIFQSAKMDPVAPPAAVPEIDFFPKSIDYGYVKRGDSITKSITISNSWTGPLSAAVQLSGANITDFPVAGTCGQQNTLAPDDSCTIDVTFKPTTAFTRNAAIVVTSNDPLTPVVTVPLTGVGLQPIITPPSPLPVSLGTVVYPMWAGTNVIVSNGGNDVLRITSATLTGSSEFSVNFDGCTGATVQGGSQCAVQILFIPQSAGTKTATVTVTSNDPDHPVLDIPVTVTVM
ncbi:MAG TPA: choice-of-anchor D domain-containing protein [Geobacteraceae bacterium]